MKKIVTHKTYFTRRKPCVTIHLANPTVDQISHNAPLCNRDVHMWAHFVTKRCFVGNGTGALWDFFKCLYWWRCQRFIVSYKGVSQCSSMRLTVGQRKKVTAVTFFRCPTVRLLLYHASVKYMSHATNNINFISYTHNKVYQFLHNKFRKLHFSISAVNKLLLHCAMVYLVWHTICWHGISAWRHHAIAWKECGLFIIEIIAIM